MTPLGRHYLLPRAVTQRLRKYLRAAPSTLAMSMPAKNMAVGHTEASCPLAILAQMCID